MPHPTQVVALLKAQQIRHVRLYNSDRGMLLALANTGIKVAVSIPNEQLLGIGQSNSTAANWVSQNIVSHYPATNITTICVGSEVPTALSNAAPVLINALKYVHSALVASNLDRQIKVSTPLASSIILDSFPPSQAFFNHSWNPVLVPLLKFLQSTNSYFMLNIYPYFDYMQSNGVIPLDYALFKPLPANKEAVDANTLLHYSNVFDAMVDAAYFAMADLNVTNVPVLVTESGWPSKGDSNEPDATLENANTYNSNLIRHVLNKTGTPKHPGISVSTFIYELYNEDMKHGPLSEKNWGLFDASGNPAALDWACGPGKVDCSAMLQGQVCYEPDTVLAHATYAFDAYYHQMGKTPGSCDFNGVAAITTTNPSHGSCLFLGSGTNGTLLNSTIPAMDSKSSDSPHAKIGFLAAYFVAGVLGFAVLFLI
ncbi:hypothetical protein RD792_017942 [Penstemon davidsonii]|uniref:X8 domain-containing protein n=1 Tax=Penstemon davidsonii TaxID=160366 RepID=A0ABR0DVE4_9LAMI|nr:hypothetical protein RD792_017942 [Penstemon davidsonii]